MRYKVSDLEGAALDAAVAKVMGYSVRSITQDGKTTCEQLHQTESMEQWGRPTRYSSDGAIAVGIIQRERITTECEGDDVVPECLWTAGRDDAFSHEHGWSFAPTLLVAAMRFYVRTKLGEEIEL